MDPILAKTLSIQNKDSTNSSLNTTKINLSSLEALPEPYQSCLAVLYCATAIIAIIANILAIMILITKKRSSADLRKYLINLAVADISMASFSIPFTFFDFMYGYWRFPPIMCPFTQFVTVCSVCVSIFTLTAIGIERYIAIVYPLKYCWWCESHTLYIICTIWVVSVLIASPMVRIARAVSFQIEELEDYCDCREEWEGEISGMIYTAVLFFVSFIIPFTALTFLYGSIGIKTFRHIQPGEAHKNRDRAHHRIKIKVVKMLLTLVSVFLICWFPIQVFELIVWLNRDLRVPKSMTHKYLYIGLYFICHWLSMAHTFLNPFIYCYMSNNFNVEDLRSLLDRRLPKSCYSTSSPHKRNTTLEGERISIDRMAQGVTPSTTKTFILHASSVV